MLKVSSFLFLCSSFMFEVKNRVLSGALDENIGTLTAVVFILRALQGLFTYSYALLFTYIQYEGR